MILYNEIKNKGILLESHELVWCDGHVEYWRFENEDYEANFFGKDLVPFEVRTIVNRREIMCRALDLPFE